MTHPYASYKIVIDDSVERISNRLVPFARWKILTAYLHRVQKKWDKRFGVRYELRVREPLILEPLGTIIVNSSHYAAIKAAIGSRA
jgi:hypothetical protein